jgi:hypothetical protein
VNPCTARSWQTEVGCSAVLRRCQGAATGEVVTVNLVV